MIVIRFYFNSWPLAMLDIPREIFENTIYEGHNFRQAEKANTWQT